jgi:hypothetical protein
VLGVTATMDANTTPPVLLSTGDPAALAVAAQRWLGLQIRAEKLAT